MAGLSTTGRASTENYVLGRGCVYVAPLDKNRTPLAWREIGNATDFTIEGDAQILEHFTNCTRNRQKDAEYSIETSFDFTITLDEWMFENLALFTVGTTSVYALNDQTGAPPGDGIWCYPNPNATDPISDTSVYGRYYDVYYDKTGNRIVIGTDATTGMDWKDRVYGLDPAQFELEIGDAAAIIYGPAEDQFTYDPETSQIYIPERTAMLPAMVVDIGEDTVTAGTATLVTSVARYKVAIAANSVAQVRGGTGASIAVALKYILFNGADATETFEIILHQVRLRPSGTLAMISGDELATIPLSGGLEANADNDSLGAGLITIRQVTV